MDARNSPTVIDDMVQHRSSDVADGLLNDKAVDLDS